ncbi:mycothiol synthase [Rhabdothermincola sp.]|uniref:mycothiol synthase n=1 Tax=Rhabdothermincola sp. TaxID=2820405 RepID=UPI002FE00038
MLALAAEPPLVDDRRASELAAIERALTELDRQDLPDQGGALLRQAVELTRAAGSVLELEAQPSPAELDAAATRAGLRLTRDLLQLRRPLPIVEHTDLAVRPFVPDQDEPAWLELNNRAFAWHPDQAGWSVADLRTREREPWFDPRGFLLHERDGRLVGFCWTKVHRDEQPPLGEIYVIAVDPAFHGRGLGRELAIAGLEHLGSLGLDTAMLYVEADNEPALALYRSLGFKHHHSHRWYRSGLP